MTKNNTFNRRDFLITLGAGTLPAIAGFFTSDAFPIAGDEQTDKTSGNPKLSERVSKASEKGKMVLSAEKAKCVVNKTGERIIGLLDGTHTLSDISAQISKHYGMEHTGVLEASIATFLCQLGSLGFLSSPFYVTMYETW